MIRSDLLVALEAADAADQVTQSLFRSRSLRIDTKPDSTPVTEADRAAERAIRDVILARRPADSIMGEEYGESGESSRRWIIDPIDATINYMRGVPVWGTLIALEDGGTVTVGVVSAPALAHRWWAAHEYGAFLNASPMRVSQTADLGEAHMSFNSLTAFESRGLSTQAHELSRRCARTRGFGDFLSFMFLADGAIDIAVEPIAKPWDLAPLMIIVTEAGGTFTDLRGVPTIRGGDAVASNGLLHGAVLDVFAAAPR